MNDGVLKINQWNAGLFGGTSKLNLEMRGGESVKLNTDISLGNVGLQSLVGALAGAPIVQSQGVTDFQTSLTTTGGSVAAMVGALSGEGFLKGTDITVRGINVAEMARALSSTDSLGGQARALFGAGIQGGASKFDTLDGVFTVARGVATFSKLDLDGADALITTTGTASLPTWLIDMKSSVQLKVEEGVEVPPPFEISYRGSLSNPGSTFAQNAIEGYINKKISTKAGEFLQDKLGDKVDGKLGGVIGGLLGVEVPQKQGQQPVQGIPNEQSQQPANEGEIQPQPQIQPASPYTPDAATNVPQETTPQQEQQPQKIEPEDVVKDVLKGLLQ
jgi:uncharacterized protein involved in outer membrane biogenesis